MFCRKKKCDVKTGFVLLMGLFSRVMFYYCIRLGMLRSTLKAKPSLLHLGFLEVW